MVFIRPQLRPEKADLQNMLIIRKLSAALVILLLIAKHLNLNKMLFIKNIG